jgi:O-antigen chain-terminating methyltransferase
MVKRRLKQVLGRVAPGLAEDRTILREVSTDVRGVAPRLEDLGRDLQDLKEQVRQVDLRINHFQHFDFRMQKLRELASRVEPYQPAYGLPGVIADPARGSIDRCRAIENHFAGSLRGKRLLDVGSSLGFVCYYFADRGVTTEGWEFNPANVEVAQLIGELNGVPATIKAHEFNRDTLDTIQPGQFDIVTLLSVLHHVVHHQGLAETKELMKELLTRVPTLVVELAVKGEDPDLFWDASLPEDELEVFDLVRDQVEVIPLGQFGTHLSDRSRPLYVVTRKNTVTVNNRVYGYSRERAEAYANSVAVLDHEDRRYYWGDDVFIKRYTFSGPESDNARLIAREVATMLGLRDLPEGPRLLDFEITGGQATIVYARAEGDLFEPGTAQAPEVVQKVVDDVFAALRALRERGLFHNDVRSWNVLWDGERATLIDYADASPVDTDGDLVSVLWLAHALSTGTREPLQQGKVLLPPRESLDARLWPLHDQVAAGTRDVAALSS